MKNIISFSLYGSEPKYCVGAVENIKLQQSIYPGWVSRFYVDKTVPEDTLKALQAGGAEIVFKDVRNEFDWLFWRFEPAFDASVERFIVRDCASRLNTREASAVKDWVESGLLFHCMRDHKDHRDKIVRALWGAKPFFIQDFKELLDWFLGQVGNAPAEKRGNPDIVFLNQIIWPRIYSKALVHDDLKSFMGIEKPFKVKLPHGQFVGQVIN